MYRDIETEKGIRRMREFDGHVCGTIEDFYNIYNENGKQFPPYLIRACSDCEDCRQAINGIVWADALFEMAMSWQLL